MSPSMRFILRRDGLPDVAVPGDMYFADLRRRTQGFIGMVEQLCYTQEGGRDKSLWGENTLAQFNSFRKRMLDLADEIGDLPERMIVDGFATSGPTCGTSGRSDGVIASLFLRSKG